MITNEYKKYLKSEKWQKLRKSVFSERGKKCEICSKSKWLHLHHLTYERIFNELPEDLQVLCRTCHEKAHGITAKKAKPKKQKMSLAQKVAHKNRIKKKAKKRLGIY
jgi:5-methylcytosine-specific restriction endonuclease McrA